MLMIGSVFWAPISFCVCWFMKNNSFDISDKISACSEYYILAVFLWSFVLMAGVRVVFGGLGCRNNDDDEKGPWRPLF